MSDRRRLALFFGLAFGISWGVPGLALLLDALLPGRAPSLAMYSPLYFVGVWGPAIAAGILVGRELGSAGLRAYLARLLDWRIGPAWWAFALLGIPAMYFCGALLQGALGSPGAISWYDGSWWVLLGVFLLRGTAGPVEELGWRGFALPVLQRIVSPWAGLVVIGLIHSLWHAPVFLVGQFGHFGTPMPFPLALARFTANVLAMTVFVHVAYNATGGRLTSAFLIHWMLNGIYPWEGEVDTLTGQVIVTAVVAGAMLLTVGRKWLRPERAATHVIPEGPERLTSVTVGEDSLEPTLESVRRAFEEFGREDPLYAALSRKRYRGNRWDPEEFFRTGREEIAQVMEYLARLGARPDGGRALDFGCGVGRLTRALAEHFQRVVGVDIARSMIERAREFEAHQDAHGGRVRYVVNAAPDLRLFEDASFDFVYSNKVLQHIPPEAQATYIGEFLRVLRPGGVAVFQTRNGPWIRPGTPRAWLYTLNRRHLRRLFQRIRGRTPYEMHYIAQSRVEEVVREAGACVVDVVDLSQGTPRKSLQYCVRR